MARAYEAGMRHVDHFWCAMSSVSSLRARYGTPMQASMEQFVLAYPEMSTEVIADGCHLAPELLEFAFRMKGADRLCLVTDANRALDMPPGRYRFGPQDSGSWFESDGPCRLRAGAGTCERRGWDGQDGAPHVGIHKRNPARCGSDGQPDTRRANGNRRRDWQPEAGKRADILVLSGELFVERVFIAGQEFSA